MRRFEILLPLQFNDGSPVPAVALPGEGFIHFSEHSWTKRITRPSDVLTAGQEVEAMVLGVNRDEQKIRHGVGQLEPSPWGEIEHGYPIGKVRLELQGERRQRAA